MLAPSEDAGSTLDGGAAKDAAPTIDANVDADGDAVPAVADASETPDVDASDASDALAQVGQPAFDPPPGTYTTGGGTCARSVRIASGTPGATIFYTTDGTMPTHASAVLAPGSTIELLESKTYLALAARSGFADSEVTTAAYVVDYIAGLPGGVTFAPSSGTYAAPLSLKLATMSRQSTICYTLDGSTPTCDQGTCTGSSATYGGAITLDAPTTLVKTLACRPCWLNSGVSQAQFDLAVGAASAIPGYAEAPVVLSAPGETVVLASSLQGATIHFTTDGSAPSCGSATYVSNGGATPVIDHDLTLKTIGCKSGYADSTEVDFEYVVR